MEIIIEEKLNELKELSGGTNQLLCDLLDKFLINAEKYLDSAKEALNTQDYEKVQFAIHTMKGSALSLGLRDLGKLLTELNKKAKENTYEGFEQGFETIQKLIEEVRTYRSQI